MKIVGHESEQTLGVSEGQGSLVSMGSQRLDTTWRLNTYTHMKTEAMAAII